MLSNLFPRISYFAVFVLLPATAFSDRPNLNRYSDSEHWENADAVAFVEIQSGSYVDEVGFDLVAKPLSTLKGSLPDSVEISVRFPSISYPDRLGAVYMVFLQQDEEGDVHLMRETYSSIRVMQMDVDSEQEIRRYAPKKSDQPIDWYDYEGSLWVVGCSTEPGYGSFCEGARSLAKYTLSEVGGVKGR